MLKLECNFLDESQIQTVDPQIVEKVFKTFKEVLNIKISKFLLKDQKGIIYLSFTNHEQIKKINFEARMKNKSTDVISIAYLEDKSSEVESIDFPKNLGEITVGEIFISIPTAQFQAQEKNHSLQKEIEILFVHGLLHLFGFDHQNDAQEKEMENWAKKILGKCSSA